MYVDTYNNPVVALRRFKPLFYDLVLIDVRMPYLNGFQFFKQLRKKDPYVKVCFLTTFQLYYDSLIEQHPRLNVKCFIRKPIDIDQLLFVIKMELNTDY